MVKRRVVGLVLGLVMALLFVAGCGGGDSSLTKAEFTKKASLVCQEWLSDKEEVIQAATRKLGSRKATQAEQENLVLGVLEPYETATEKIEDLGVPEGEEKEVEAILDARKEAAERTKANPESALVSTAAFKKANEEAEKYGLEHCQA
jgi:hypothetical protein